MRAEGTPSVVLLSSSAHCSLLGWFIGRGGKWLNGNYKDCLLHARSLWIGYDCCAALACRFPPGPQGNSCYLKYAAGTVSRANSLRVWLLRFKIAHDEKNVGVVL